MARFSFYNKFSWRFRIVAGIISLGGDMAFQYGHLWNNDLPVVSISSDETGFIMTSNDKQPTMIRAYGLTSDALIFDDLINYGIEIHSSMLFLLTSIQIGS
ncbi:hypothetical protein [Sporolactobacillus pectinivorans]|uniref:hypothetical protein n=1 Tax=Sporolactobacillus pectinivorans TaxID=1591408 RepID=UPI000C25B9F4|nr:hypothetical protein [Sporolactobacillus pectinivorans]